jgi:potassium efflux system protein
LSKDPVAASVLELRAAILSRLESSQRALIRDLASYGTDKKAFRDLVVELKQFVGDQLFWRRSSEPLGPKFFKELPGATARLLGPDSWRSLGASLFALPKRHPGGSTLVGILLAVLLWKRRRLRSWIVTSEQKTRRISTDRIGHTLGALGSTALLALPLPLLCGFLSWGLASEPNADAWTRGFGLWLGWVSLSLLTFLFVLELVRPKGAGCLHFSWSEEACAPVRKGLPLLMGIFLPTMFFPVVALFDAQASGFGSIGRLGFILGHGALIWVLFGMFRPEGGVFYQVQRGSREGAPTRRRMLWFALLVLLPAVWIILALLGYTLTAFILSDQYFNVVRWVLAGILLYCVGVRWFMIRQRRLAVTEALEERRARREAADHPPEESEETVTVDDDSIELDLDDVAQQTRQLLRSLVGLGVLIAIAYTVVQALPIEQANTELGLEAGFDWLGLLKAVLIGTVTLTTVRNLPGLLDLFGLRSSGMTAGTRYAVATLCQYAIGAIGIFAVTSALAVDWAKLSFIAAALSVGLGFGLQEIVANFVCGIILLFERPIRVGDVVTVGEVTGSVSRIRMRATTITNWDRQEFVVPNKDFITGSLINWTLSSPLNRITIPVGVAYGSDTVKAREILADIAQSHPAVLDDPAPLISFEAFADSTLNLVLRCYLPTMDSRIRTITDIHEQIDQRFKEAGIEIAFPQRELHLRTVPDEWKGPRQDAAGD